ncbi:MAG: gas vesicle protein GvpN [Pseudomonadota bacterium]
MALAHANDVNLVTQPVLGRHDVTPVEGKAGVDLSIRTDLYEDDAVRSIQSRSLAYLRAGIPVHLRGPAGTGKSTMALQIAAQLGRPSVIVTGDAWLKASDLVGREAGIRSKQVVDKYIQSVRKVETESSPVWADGLLATAMVHGYTFVYDEFSRSPAEANNVLLMALEERTLVINHPDRKTVYINAHPDFRAILTSNPREYAGVQQVPDALMDRVITLNLDGHVAETEAGIVAARTGLDDDRARAVVDTVATLRSIEGVVAMPSVRAALMIGHIVKSADLSVSADDLSFVQLCVDVFLSKADATQAQRDFRPAFIKALHKNLQSKPVTKRTNSKGARQEVAA